jgi:hypothetical protein
VLAARPFRVREQWTTELFGDYSPETMLIRVWLRPDSSQLRRAGRFVWKLLVGLAYVFFGVYLILHPVLGVASLTLVLAVLFLIEGVLNVILFFQIAPKAMSHVCRAKVVPDSTKRFAATNICWDNWHSAVQRRGQMEGTQFRYAIKFVADMDRAVKFHRDVLGLKVKFESPGWSEFATGETTLALHPASDKNPAGKIELGFTVADVEAA